ncbi:TPA: deoxyribonuclease IV [Candidatus Poribacteria bacterium]|nr:deoxyribonuclease IV [Candidatus Poribacteria bacterium]
MALLHLVVRRPKQSGIVSKRDDMILGAHVSTQGGLHNSISIGEGLGCQAIQIFTKNPNRWVGKELIDNDVKMFVQRWRNSTIDIVLAHDSHLTNLASTKPDVLARSYESFLQEIDRASRLKIPYLITHLGAHLSAGEKAGLRLLSENLNKLLHETIEADVTVLLETTAGQGTNLGYRFEQIKQVMDSIEQKHRIGACVDTCHIFAAGYDIRTAESYQATFDKFDRIIGIEHLKVFHLNDSKSGFNSRVDRHEHIGSGEIGLEGFKFLISDERFKRVPMIIETPQSGEMHQINLEILKRLIGG